MPATGTGSKLGRDEPRHPEHFTHDRTAVCPFLVCKTDGSELVKTRKQWRRLQRSCGVGSQEAWVRHTQEVRVERHFCTPRMELHSGRSLNIAPAGYERTFDSLRDLMNKTHGWADPMDVERAAEVRPVSEAPDRANGRDGLHAWVGDQISMELIEDRAGMIAALTDAGFEVPRAGKNYLTVKDTETQERFRLIEDVFHENWRAEATADREIERGHGADQSRERRFDRRTVAELQNRFETQCRKRVGYNQNRYGR